MKRPDPRLAKVERLLAQAVHLLGEMKAGVPAPPRPRRRRKGRFGLAQILHALREGASLDAKGKDRDPRLPCSATISKYRRQNARFNSEAGEILALRRRRGAAPARPPRKKRLPGDRYDWAVILEKIRAGATIGPTTANRNGLPAHTLIMARRKAVPEFGAAIDEILDGRRAGLIRPLDKEYVLERIRCGAVIKADPPEPGMPARHVIVYRRKVDKQFDADIRAAIAEARRRRCNRQRLTKLGRDAVWHAAQAAVPQTINQDQRDDIVSELTLLICSGELDINGDLARSWKRCRTSLNGHRWKELSLDAPLAGTAGLTRLDMLSDETSRI